MTKTREDLAELVRTTVGDLPFLVVSNREPYMHIYEGDAVRCIVPASGLTTALDPVLRASGGTWIAHGSGNADLEVVDDCDKVAVPPDNPSYWLKRVWLPKKLEEGYYYGFANQALWPLCHIAYVRPVFEEVYWNAYKEANQLFANAVLDEIGDSRAIVFIQDYHFALLSKFIKERNPNVFTAHFWHIPWPNREAFRICPWQNEILDGLLSNDLLGFHIQYHCNNFLNTVDRTIESRVDYERYEATRNGKTTSVKAFPISIDFDEMNRSAQMLEVDKEMSSLKHRFGLEGKIVLVGLDRIDYTKGLPERLKAFDRFLEMNPEYEEKVVFVQAGVISRIHIDAYHRVNEEIDDLVEKINWRHGSGRWRPIVYAREHLSPVSLLALRRLANVAVVSSLHDGMNLVAKEFVASRFDEDGVLLLSLFTGAAREMAGAVEVNPYAIDQFASAIKLAIEMPLEERQRRMRAMRRVVEENNIYEWASSILSHISKLTMGVMYEASV